MDETKWTPKRLLKFFILSCIGLSIVFCGYATVIFFSLPKIANPSQCITSTMYKVRLCPESNNYIQYSKLPPLLIKSLVMSEDASFFSHSGFDWYEIKESFYRNLSDGRLARGGSTITQQLAKNLYLSPSKTISRKLKEVFIANQIEKLLTKKQILEKYLNVVEFADAIYGIKQAAEYYFSKSPSRLNLLESVYLISLLPNPKKYGASLSTKKLSSTNVRRMKSILRRLERSKAISTETKTFATLLVDNQAWPFENFQHMDLINSTAPTLEDELINEFEGDLIDDPYEELEPSESTSDSIRLEGSDSLPTNQQNEDLTTQTQDNIDFPEEPEVIDENTPPEF